MNKTKKIRFIEKSKILKIKELGLEETLEDLEIEVNILNEKQ